MKKKILFLGAVLLFTLFGSLKAQTDVTNTYLTNTGFDSDPITFLKSSGKNTAAVRHLATGWMYEIAGWTQASVCNANAVQVATAEYGAASSSEGLNGVAPPTMDMDGHSSGACLHLSAGWGDKAILTQNVNLQPGKYELTYSVFNAHTSTGIASNYFGYLPDQGTATYGKLKVVNAGEWAMETVTFTVVSGSGKISIGCTTSANGSANGAKLYLDNLKLFYYGVDKTELNAKIADANTAYGSGAGIGAAALNVAITAANAVATNTNATMAEVVQAITDLKAALLTYQLANASMKDPAEVTELIVNPNFENDGLAGWTNNGMAAQTNTSFALKSGTVYVEKWIAAPGTVGNSSISQHLTSLPNGNYILYAVAQALQGEEGAGGSFIYANDAQVEVSFPDLYELNFKVVDGTATIGFRNESSTANYTCVDDFILYYCGVNADPVLMVDHSSLNFFGFNYQQKIRLAGEHLTGDIQITGPQGISFSKSTITPAEFGGAMDIMVTYDKLAAVDGTITISSGSITKTITVKGHPQIGNNLVGYWNGNGVTGTGSEPNNFGWTASGPVISWGTANGGNVRYLDRTGTETDLIMDVDGSTPFVGRVLYIRWDGTGGSSLSSVYAYPVQMEAGKEYKVSVKYEWHNNGDAGNITKIKVSPATDGSAALDSVTHTFSTKLHLTDITLSVAPKTTGLYYVTFSSDKGTLGAIAEMSVTEIQRENLMKGWDADGKTGTGTKASENGWASTTASTPTWSDANVSGGVRYVDAGVANGYTNYNLMESETNTIPYTSGRILWLRWGDAGFDKGSYYTYKIKTNLEIGKTYKFSWKYAWHNNDNTAPSITAAICKSTDGVTGKIASEIFVASSTKQLLKKGEFSFVVPASGEYYLSLSASTGAMIAIADLSLAETLPITILTLDKTSLGFSNFELAKDFVVTGHGLIEDITLTAPAGLTLNKTTITPAEAEAGVAVTATYDGETTLSGAIEVRSRDLVKTINVSSSFRKPMDTQKIYHIVHSSGLYLGESATLVKIFAPGSELNKAFKFIDLGLGVYAIQAQSNQTYLAMGTANAWDMTWVTEPSATQRSQFVIEPTEAGYVIIKCLAKTYMGTDAVDDGSSVYIDKPGTEVNHYWFIEEATELSADKVVLDKNALLYPTVTEGDLIINKSSGVSINIYDLAGNKVIATILSGNMLNVSSLKRGMYILTTGDGETAKFIKK